MKIKRLIGMLLFSCVLLSFGGCMSRSEKVLEGKEGLFAVIETPKGEIVLELFYKQAPLTVTNFVGFAEGTLDAAKGKPFYDGLKFHRVISRANRDSQDFMIQGGDPKGNGTGGPGYQFVNEIVEGLDFSKAGMLAMANAGEDTNGSQFFITIVPTTYLNGGYTIFGKVVDSESQKVVNSVVQGDKMTKITIVRKGAEAEAFTATQADWNRENDAANKRKMKALMETLEKAFPGYTIDSTGIRYKITKEGNGEKCGKGKSVAIHYRGYFVDGTVFDSSEGRSPLEFVTDANKMIKGFDLMVQDMKVGEKRTIVLPPEYGYGASGYPGVIPGNAYIAFDLELVSAR